MFIREIYFFFKYKIRLNNRELLRILSNNSIFPLEKININLIKKISIFFFFLHILEKTKKFLKRFSTCLWKREILHLCSSLAAKFWGWRFFFLTFAG